MIHTLRLPSLPIYEQLLLEERLLRASTHNWCLINSGSPPAIVLGISGKKEELVDEAKTTRDQIPLIRRFSGGGTVSINPHTLFVTFIFQCKDHPFPPFPEPILRWSAALYKEAFQHSAFDLRENDYVLYERKCGGNAQYIKKERWLHHTSFLWDYSEEQMQYLLHPKKTPTYRQHRSHTDFVCRLKDFFPSEEFLMTSLLTTLQSRYTLIPTTLEEALTSTPPLERSSTVLLSHSHS